MLFARLSLLALASIFVSVAAVPRIIAPGGSNLWWVAKSDNNLVWDCNDKTYDSFNVVIANPSVNVLAAPLTLIATLPNYICSKLVPASTIANLPSATGYTVMLTDILNSTHIYSTSDSFEIKAVGSSYPASTATPSPGSTGTLSGTSSGSQPSSSSGSSNSNGGSRNVLSAIGAFAAVVVGVMTA